MAQTRVSITKDNVGKVFKALGDLVGKQVLVGIPESNAPRNDGEEANNAQIAYVHEFGSPANNIPARPFLIPGVQKAEKPALYQLRKAADAALDGDATKSDGALTAAGIIGANYARSEINSNIPPPLSPATIRNRHRQRGTKSMRESEQVYLGLIDKGVDPGAAQEETGIISLINTGQLRNSITSVVRKL